MNIVLFAYFSDDNKTNDPQLWNNDDLIGVYSKQLNPRYTKLSLEEFIEHISENKFGIKTYMPQVVNGTIKPYEIRNTTSTTARTQFVDVNILQEVLYSITLDSDVDYDLNDDGNIDSITLILNGRLSTYEFTKTPPSLWPHKQNVSNVLNVKGTRYTVKDYNFTNSYAALRSPGVPFHEFLHTLKFEDLYPQDISSTPVGKWDIMGRPTDKINYPLAYTRYHLYKWVKPVEIKTSTQNVEVFSQDMDGRTKFAIIKSPYNENEIFVVELRKQNSNNGKMDQDIPATGVIVYKVNKNISNLSNFTGRLAIKVITNGSIIEVALPRNGVNQIGNENLSSTENALVYENERNSGIHITNIAIHNGGNRATFDVSIPVLDESTT